jgi:hypothetical protein
MVQVFGGLPVALVVQKPVVPVAFFPTALGGHWERVVAVTFVEVGPSVCASRIVGCCDGIPCGSNGALGGSISDRAAIIGRTCGAGNLHVLSR